MTWSLTIPRACPSQNKFAWSHWRVAHREKELWKQLIRAADGFLDIPKATGKRRMIVERFGWKILDEPNLIGGLKGIVDNLVQLGLLVDDKPSMLELGGVIQNQIMPRTKVRPHTVLHLEDCK